MSERPRLVIAGLLSLLAAALVAYSQTMAFAWDEGWHLLAAQSILRGRLPYLDFIYSQTPLNAFWNAGWMRLFGDTWRTANGVAAVMTALAVWLTADYLRARFPIVGWRLPAAIAVAFLVGLNVAVLEYGTIGQAYGLCLFMIVAAFRLTVLAVDRPGPLVPAAAGFCACAATNASLLTAPVGPVLLIWMLVYNRKGNRLVKFAAYAGAALMACVPLVWLFSRGPRQTLFSVLDYNWKYRLLSWDGAIAHDIGVMLSWIDCASALMLVVLGAAGLYFVRKLSGWERGQRAEFYLCAWLAVTIACHIANGHPNFPRYYLLTAPFLGILSCAGLFAIGSRLAGPDRPFWPVTLVCVLACLGVGKLLWDAREDMSWPDVEEVARKVNEVTPPGALLFADEPTYFVSRHPPYPGCELADSHKITLPPEQAKMLHLIPREELNRLIQAGTFDTVQMESDDRRIEELGIARLYQHESEVDENKIFWGKAAK